MPSLLIASQVAKVFPFKEKTKVPPNPDGFGTKVETVRFRFSGLRTPRKPQRVLTNSPRWSKILIVSKAQETVAAGVEVGVAAGVNVEVLVGLWVAV